MAGKSAKQSVCHLAQHLLCRAADQRNAGIGEKQDKACLSAARVAQRQGILRHHRSLQQPVVGHPSLISQIFADVRSRPLILVQRFVEALRKDFPCPQLRRMVDQQHQLTAAHRGADLFNQTAAVADPDLVAEIKTEQLKFFLSGSGFAASAGTTSSRYQAIIPCGSPNRPFLVSIVRIFPLQNRTNPPFYQGKSAFYYRGKGEFMQENFC